MLPFIITSLVLACLFEGLSAHGRTVVDLDKRLIKHTPAATFPPVLIGIDDIDSITCRKYWFYNNLKITTKAGKKTFKISVDDPKRFIEALIAEKQTADNQ